MPAFDDPAPAPAPVSSRVAAVGDAHSLTGSLAGVVAVVAVAVAAVVAPGAGDCVVRGYVAGSAASTGRLGRAEERDFVDAAGQLTVVAVVAVAGAAFDATSVRVV